MLIRRLARPMLAAPFIREGLRTAIWPAAEVERWRESSVVRSVTSAASVSDEHLDTVVRAKGALTAALGVTFAFGIMPRLSALGLAATSFDDLIVNNPFDKSADDRAARIARCVDLLGRTGGALIASADLAGKPGAKWRIDAARHERHDLKKGHHIDHIALV